MKIYTEYDISNMLKTHSQSYGMVDVSSAASDEDAHRVKEKIQKGILQKIEGTGYHDIFLHLIETRKVEMECIDWHRALVRPSPISTGVVETDDVPSVVSGRNAPTGMSHQYIQLPKLKDIVQRNDDAWICKRIDIDTYSLCTDRIFVFRSLTLGVASPQQAREARSVSNRRGRWYLVPRRRAGDIDLLDEGEFLPHPIPILKPNKLPSPTQGPATGLWPWRTRKLIGKIDTRYGTLGSYLYVCQMGVQKSTPESRVAWSLVVKYIMNESNRVGPSASRLDDLSSSPNPCTMSEESLKALDGRLRDVNMQRLFFVERQTQTIMLDEWEKHGGRLVHVPGEITEERIDRVISNIRETYLTMLQHLWFVGEKQLGRQECGKVDEARSRGEESIGDSAKDIGTRISENVMMKELATITDEKEPFRVFLVPSVAMEVSVIRQVQGAIQNLFAQNCPFFEAPQTIRVHLSQSSLGEEKRRFREHNARLLDGDDEELPGPVGSLVMKEYTSWGSHHLHGPRGFNARMSICAPVRNGDDEGAVIGMGIAELCEAYVSDELKEELQRCSEEDGIHLWGHRDVGNMYFSSNVIGYETAVRGYDKTSKLFQKQDDLVPDMLGLVMDEPGIPASQVARQNALAGICDYVESTVNDFLRSSPEGSPYRIEETSVWFYCSTPEGDEDGVCRDIKFRTSLQSHFEKRVKRLLRMDVENFCSYSYHEEFPEILKSLSIPWIRLLKCKGSVEIQRNNTVSYETTNAIAMCVGALSHMLFGLDRKLEKSMPIAQYFRSTGKAFHDSSKQHGIYTIPLPLLLGMSPDGRKSCLEMTENGIITYAFAPEDDHGRSVVNFIAKELLYKLLMNQRLPSGVINEEEDRALRCTRRFTMLLTWMHEIFSFMPPSCVPFLWLNILATMLIENLVKRWGFEMSVSFVHSGRRRPTNERWKLIRANAVYFDTLAHRDGVNVRFGIQSRRAQPIVVGCEPGKSPVAIFGQENFESIMNVLKRSGTERERNTGRYSEGTVFERRDQGDEEDMSMNGRYVDTIIQTLADRMNPRSIQQGYNQTLCMSFFCALFRYMKTLQYHGGDTLTLESLENTRSWGHNVLKTILVAGLNKARMSHVMSFKAGEERYGTYRFVPAKYPNPVQVMEAEERLEELDKAWYLRVMREKLGLITSEQLLQPPHVVDAEIQRYKIIVKKHALHLLNTRMASFWALVSTETERVHIQQEDSQARERGQTEVMPAEQISGNNEDTVSMTSSSMSSIGGTGSDIDDEDGNHDLNEGDSEINAFHGVYEDNAIAHLRARISQLRQQRQARDEGSQRREYERRRRRRQEQQQQQEGEDNEQIQGEQPPRRRRRT